MKRMSSHKRRRQEEEQVDSTLLFDYVPHWSEDETTCTLKLNLDKIVIIGLEHGNTCRVVTKHDSMPLFFKEEIKSGDRLIELLIEKHGWVRGNLKHSAVNPEHVVVWQDNDPCIMDLSKPVTDSMESWYW